MTPTDAPRRGPIGRVVAWCADHPVLTVLAVVIATIAGLRAIREVPLDAVPDLSDPQVILFTEWPGRSPDLVEDQITYPLSTALLATPRVRYVRGQSMFGMSFVYVVFEDGTDPYWARSRVLEYVSQARGALPDGVEPELGPDASAVGWIYQYALVDRTGSVDLQQLRAIQDFELRYALQSVEGVAEVASIGGFVKEYQIQLDPDRLLAYGVTVPDVARAVRASNTDAGGQSIEIAGHEHVIRGRGYLRGVDDLEQVPVKLAGDGTPVLVRDVAWVGVGPASRRGFAELDGQGEVVGGIVVMRHGENALQVIERVEARLAEVAPGLPPGVEVVEVYDRSDLIERAVDTLRTTLVEEMIVVSAVVFLFLLHARSALVPILTLPVGVVLAFLPMAAQGIGANIMSLGGIAVAIGAMVDASIVILENVHTRLQQAGPDPESSVLRRQVVVGAMQEVGPSLFYSLLVMTVSFLPVFALQSTEGRLFAPLAYTKTYSMGFAAVLAVTLTPALVALLIRGAIRREEDHPVTRTMSRAYEPVVRAVVRAPGRVIAVAVALLVLTIPPALSLGWEYMPPLNEGALLFMPTAPPGMGATEAANAMQVMDRKIAAVPEVRSVFGKMGRAETATDPAPMGMAETTVVLAPREEWRPGLTWDALLAELDQAVQIPGMPNLWWMPIQTRTEMLTTGIRSPLGIQVYGDDVETIEAAAVRIEGALAEIEGTRSVFAERSTGGFYLDVDVDRPAAARLGLTVEDVHAVVQTAIGGLPVTETVEGRERYPVTVRYARGLRDDPDALEQVLVPTASGAQVPLAQVADLAFRTGPPMIRSEDGALVGYVFVDPGDVRLSDYVRQARAAIADLRLQGVRVAFAGQYQHLERAWARLAQVLPLTLVLVAFLLWLNTRSAVETGIVLLAVPFSLIGAVWLMWALGYPLSVAACVGLIALAGLDAETAVVMLLYLTLAHDRRRAEGRLASRADLEEAIVEGAARRIRPKAMTVLTTMIGLAPILWSTGTGADVMKRIAAPMVGGLVSSFLLELAVYPAIFAVWKGRGMPAAAEER